MEQGVAEEKDPVLEPELVMPERLPELELVIAEVPLELDTAAAA